VNLLLDSHVALWWADDPARLDPGCRAAIAAPETDVWFSAASAWELSIKVRSGKLSVDVGRLVRRLRDDGVSLLGIGIEHASAAGGLAWDHRDPFDRMLVAQADVQDLTLATRDSAMLEFLGSGAMRA